MKVLAIDPGTKSGFAFAKYTAAGAHEITSGTWDLAVKKITKKQRLAGEEQKPHYYRLLNLWNILQDFKDCRFIIIEGAAGFTRGKSAIEASHKFRAIIELFCSLNGIDKVELTPEDLKRFALGKGVGEKQEMIDACVKRFGFTTTDDNEADAYLLLQWAYHNIVIPF